MSWHQPQKTDPRVRTDRRHKNELGENFEILCNNSMAQLENVLYRSLSRDAITEEKYCKSLPESERMGVRRLPLGQQSLPREPFIRQLTIASTLLTSSSSDDSSDEGTWVPRRGDHDRLPLLKYKTLEWSKWKSKNFLLTCCEFVV